MAGEKKSTLLHDALILFAITLVAALALGAVYAITKEPIARANEQAKTDAYRSVFPEMKELKASEVSVSEAQSLISSDSAYEGVSVSEILNVIGTDGSVAGHVMTIASSKGYGGEIKLAVGIDSDGTLKGISFLSISETAGLGMKARDESFTSQFKDVRTGSFSLSKKGITGDTPVDAISSATITTTAVTRTVNAALRISSELLARGGVN